MPFISAAVFVLAAASLAQPAAAQGAINDLGQIASSDSLGGFIDSGGVAADMPAMAASRRTVPFGIGNAGVFVGSWTSATDSLTHGFVYQQGSYNTWDLPLADESLTAIRSISLDGRYSAGQTSGNHSSVPTNQVTNGGVVMGADGRYGVVASVPGVTGRPTFRAINDSGLVAGFAPQTDGTTLSFLGDPLGRSAFRTLAMPGAVTTTARLWLAGAAS